MNLHIQGYNCSLFAYGQTGAGKTYSIFGDFEALQKNIYTDSRGILPRLIEDIIEEANACNDQKYTLTCSYIEIYNEQILDLVRDNIFSYLMINAIIRFEKIKRGFLSKDLNNHHLHRIGKDWS